MVCSESLTNYICITADIIYLEEKHILEDKLDKREMTAADKGVKKVDNMKKEEKIHRL